MIVRPFISGFRLQNNTIADSDEYATAMRLSKKPSPVTTIVEIDPLLVNADIQLRPNAEISTTIAPTIASSPAVSLIVSTIGSGNSSTEFPVQNTSAPSPSINSVNPNVASTTRTPNYNDGGADDDETTESSESNEAYEIPLKIILPVPHVHANVNAPDNGTFERYNYILLKVNDSAFHEHFAYDKPLHLFPVSQSMPSSSTSGNTSDGSSISISTTTPTSTDKTSTSEQDNVTQSTTPYGSDNEIYRRRSANQSDSIALLSDSEGYRYQRGKLHQILNETGDIVAEFEDIHYAHIEVPETNSNRVVSGGRELQFDATTEEPIAANDDAYDQHYGKMLQWIHYHL